VENEMSDVETVKAAKKRHRCSWCAEGIEAGDTYKRYRWFGDDGPATVKMHPECHDAMIELSQEWGEDIEFHEGDNPRGCNCGHSRGCDRCEARKAQTHNAGGNAT
jgi:hypothetical protein